MHKIFRSEGVIESTKSTSMFDHLKLLTSLKGLSAINLSSLRSINNHNKSFMPHVLLVFLIINMTACGGSGVGGSGVGSSGVDADGDGLIEIYNATQLNLIHEDLARTSPLGGTIGCTDSVGNSITECSGYELMADIDLTEVDNWKAIGSCGISSACDNPFGAIFDGNGYIISNITISRRARSNTRAYGVGFFAAISEGSELRNVVLHNVRISLSGAGAYYYVGGLVGQARNALIINSSIVDITIEGTASLGSAGGLVGNGRDARIESSYAVVDSISGSHNYVGGLVGYGGGARIESSYAIANSISGAHGVGGLSGGGYYSIIASSYARVDDIRGQTNVGGLVGSGRGARIISSYALTKKFKTRLPINVHTNLSPTSYRVDGLIGGIDNNTNVISSYWRDGVFYDTSTTDSATTTRPRYTSTDDGIARTPSNSGASQPEIALRSGTNSTGGIYSAWTNAWCDSATGEFTTNNSSPLAKNTNFAWDFGTATQYPALTCLAN